ncbi:MAG TPA: hypothetical protein VEH04_00525 [Verrucomicrobiae bacterium]|nr:hypothetical protein [Verrucomicrobiae bacterium]
MEAAPHFADFIFTLRDDEGSKEAFREVFVAETKGLHLKGSADSEYKRSVFDVCNDHVPLTIAAANAAHFSKRSQSFYTKGRMSLASAVSVKKLA